MLTNHSFINLVSQAKRCIWVFSDAGGAKQVLAAYKFVVKHSNYINHTLLSDRWHSFYNMFQLPVHVLPTATIEVKQILNNIQPDLVITATSYSSGIEHEFIKECSSRNIGVASIIDHNNYPELRFNRNNIDAYPNHIVVFNEENRTSIKKLLLHDGISIEICQNFYFQYLIENFNPSISREDFTNLHQLENGKPIILYAPEPLSIIKEKFKYSIDERDGLKMTLDALKESNHPCKLIYQCHPNQNRELLKPLEKNNWTYGKADVTDALWHADVIISFCSNSILEARAIGKTNTISIMSERIPKHFEHVKKEELGYAVENTKELTQLLNQILL